MFLNLRQINRAALTIRPSTLLKLHGLLRKRKYRLLHCSDEKRKPGPKGASQEIIEAVHALKQCNPHFGYTRIEQQINQTFGTAIDKNDLLFRYHQWQANLRILCVDQINSIPYTPTSHPFIEGLVGSIRREYLDQLFFWNARDLQRKLASFAQYYNQHRVRQSLDGQTPTAINDGVYSQRANLAHYSWQSHCQEYFQTLMAA